MKLVEPSCSRPHTPWSGRQCLYLSMVCLLCCALLFIDAAPGLSGEEGNTFQRVTNRNEWYHNSTMGFLIEFPVSYEDQLIELIRRAKLDFITGACDFFGPVVYPSKVPATEPFNRATMDHIRLYSDVAKKMGIKFIAGFYGLNSYPAAEQRPEWRAMRADGTPYMRGRRASNMCVNTAFPEELMLPRLKEVYEHYKPDAFWFDCDNWYYQYCYCENCTRLFREEYGIDPPKQRSDPNWEKFAEFHRKSYDRYIKKVADFIHALDPDIGYVTNWAYTFMQPEPMPEYIDFVSSDIGQARRTEMVSFYAHHLDAEPTPWDALLSTWIGEPENPNDFRPPKSIDYYLQGYAVAASHGGSRAHLWPTFNRDDYLHPHDIDMAEKVSVFLHERDDVFKNTAPVRRIAILHSASTYYKKGSGLYGHGPALHRVLGANLALRQMHLHSHILNEEYLLDNMDAYKVIVVPEQTVLPARVISALRQWTEKGGSLILTGLSATEKKSDGGNRMLLSDVLGVDFAEADTINPGFIRSEYPVFHAPLRTAFYPVRTSTATVVTPLEKDKNIYVRDVLPYPAVTLNSFGKGKAIYISADIFTYYFQYQYPGILHLIEQLMKIADPLPQIETDAPKALTFSLRSKNSDLIVHMVNEGTDWDMGHFSDYSGAFYVENVPPTGAFSVKIRCPKRPVAIRAVPAAGDIEWRWDKDGAWIKVPGVHIHRSLVLESVY